MPRVSKGTRVNRRTKPQTLPTRFEPGFIQKLDQRTETARSLRANYEAVCNDLGGEQELSYLQRSLVERALWMEALMADVEYKMMTARQSDDAALITQLIGRWAQMVNAYSGLCARLGLERKGRTVDLRSYINANGNDPAGDFSDK